MRNIILPIRKSNLNDSRFLVKNHKVQKEREKIFLRAEKKKEPLTQNSTQQTILQNGGKIKTFSDERQLRQFVASRSIIKNGYKKFSK